MSKMITRRKNMRISLDIEAHYKYGGEWQKCQLFDLSIEGAGLRVHQSFVRGDNIILRLIHNKEEIILNTTILNTYGTRIGIKFNEITDSHQNFINKMMSTLRKY